VLRAEPPALAGARYVGHSFLTGLYSLTTNDFTLVTHALALVRVGLAQLADVGGHFADLLLVDALDRETGRSLDAERDALGSGHQHWVREPERELEVTALGHDAVTGADDLEGLDVPLGDASDHVGDQCARQAVQRLGDPLVVRASDVDDAVLATGDRDGLGHDVAERALGALDRDLLALDRDVDAGRYDDRQPSNATHLLTPYQT
jgi:hypothetical protein